MTSAQRAMIMAKLYSLRVRTEFTQSACTVFAYPSSGRMILKTILGVELDYVGLFRTDLVQRHQGDTMEDEFALKLLQIGARWWPSLKNYHRHPRTPSDNSTVRLEEYDTPEKPETWVRVAFSSSIDEWYAMLRGFGATLHEDRGCHGLEEGVAEGKREEELMRKMGDDHCLDKWMESL